MHRLILGIKDKNIKVDHIDGNGLNNVRSNLRLATHAENMRNRKKHSNNTTGYRGVQRVGKKYRAECRFNGKKYYGPVVDSAEMAYANYVEISKRLFGEFRNRHE